MKTFNFVALMLISASTLCLNSCSKKVDTVEQMPQPVIQDEAVSMVKYNAVVKAEADLIRSLVLFDRNTTKASESSQYSDLCDNLKSDANEFVSLINFSQEDMREIFGENYSNQDADAAAVGLLLFASTLDNCSTVVTRGRSFKECFLEATGIAAGAVIVGSLGKNMLSKTVLKSAIKLVAGTAGKALSGIGLALIVAEIAYCMW